MTFFFCKYKNFIETILKFTFGESTHSFGYELSFSYAFIIIKKQNKTLIFFFTLS